MKYALPWEDVSVGYQYYIRRMLDTDDMNVRKFLDCRYHPCVWKDVYGNWWSCTPVLKCDSKEAGMKRIDAMLETNGIMSISKERAEKLMLLL